MTPALIAELRAELEKHREAAAAVERLLALYEPTAAPAKGNGHAAPPHAQTGNKAKERAPAHPGVQGRQPGEIRIAVLEVLTRLPDGDTITATDITSKLLAGGIKIPRDKASVAVSNALQALKVTGTARKDGMRWSLA